MCTQELSRETIGRQISLSERVKLIGRLFSRLSVPTVFHTGGPGFIALTGLLLLDGQLGPMTLQTRRMGAVALYLIAAAVVYSAAGLSKASRCRPLGCFGIIFGIFFVSTTYGALLYYIFAIACLAAFCKTGHLSAGAVEISFSYVAFETIRQFVPELRSIDEAFCMFASAYVEKVRSVGFNGTPTSLGLPALSLAGFYLLYRWYLFHQISELLHWLLLVVAWIISLPLWIPASSAGTEVLFTRSAVVSLVILALTIFPGCVSQKSKASYKLENKKQRRVFLAVALLMAVFCGVVAAGGLLMLEPANRRILVHNRGGLDWERPVFGKFGSFSGGMFGLLPVYSRANGFEFEILDEDIVTQEDLSNTQLLILINSPKEWSTAEKSDVKAFVERGGSLLVLGDHTDVFGLMKGFNSLTADFGIRFRFDSAYHCRKGWRGCCFSAPDTVTSQWDMDDAGVAIGASLELKGSARPLLIGRYSHSDIGLAQNKIGSFLGNYSLDDGEQLGDLPLVALANHGKGRVVVWGDTSPFQGSGTFSFSKTVGPLFQLLSRKAQALEWPQTRRITAVALVSMLVLGLLLQGGAEWSIAAISLALFVGFQSATLINARVLDSPLEIAADCFLVDESQFPATGHYEAGGNSVGPLYTCLSRCGLRVARLKSWNPEAFRKARGIAFVAPKKIFSQKQVSELIAYERSGGVVIVAAGHPDASGVAPLLTAHGVSLAPEPLGTIPAGSEKRNTQVPRFLDAYPIIGVDAKDVHTNPAIDILYEVDGDVTAVFCANGEGGLLLYADTRFFSSVNVERESTYREGNLAFIHDTFRKYLRVEPNSVRPLFQSPEKPE